MLNKLKPNSIAYDCIFSLFKKKKTELKITLEESS